MASTLFRTTETVTGEGGEIKSHKEVATIKSTGEPMFFKHYVDDISKLYRLGFSRGVLDQFLSMMDYDGNVQLNLSIRKQIAEKLEVSVQSVRNSTTKLKREGVIFQIEENHFVVNPELFAKGKWSEVTKQREAFSKLTMTVQYTKGKRVVKTEANL
jgi:hypothetical protein